MTEKPIVKYFYRGEWHEATVKDVGDLSKLATNIKTDLVSAINDLVSNGALPPGVQDQLDNIDTELGGIKEELGTGGLNENQKLEIQKDLEKVIIDMNSAYENSKLYTDTQVTAAKKEFAQKTTEIQTDLDDAKGKISGVETNLGEVKKNLTDIDLNIVEVEKSVDELNGQISQKVSVADFDLVEAEVKKHTTEIGQNRDAISLKASQESLNHATDRVKATEAELKVHADKIEQTVTSEEMREEIEKIDKYSPNILRNTRDWAVWKNYAPESLTVLGDTYKLCHILEVKDNNKKMSIVADNLEVGATYTVSVQAKSDNTGATVMLDASTVSYPMTNQGDSTISSQWGKIEASFVATDEEMEIGFRFSGISVNSKGYLSAPKLEKGAKSSGWQPNVEDIYEKTILNQTAIEQTSDKITQVVKTVEKQGENIETNTTSINQLGESIELNAQKIQEVDGAVKENSAQLKIANDKIETKVEETDLSDAIGNISLDGRNRILNSDFAFEFDKWTGSTTKFNIVEKQGVKFAFAKRSGLTADQTLSISTNKFSVKKDERLIYSFYFSTDKLAELDNKSVATLELYNISDVRVDKVDISTADTKGVGDGLIARYNGVYVSEREDVVKAALVFHLRRNGTVYFTRAMAQSGSIGSTDWESAPEDSQLARIKLETSIKQTADSIELKADKTELDDLTGQVGTNSSAIKQNTESIGLSVKESKEYADDIGQSVKQYTDAQILVEKGKISQTVSEVKGIADGANQKIDDLSVGGRNYLLGTGETLTSNPTGTTTYDWRPFVISPKFWENPNRSKKGHIKLQFDIKAKQAFQNDFTSNIWFSSSPYPSFGIFTYPKDSTDIVHIEKQWAITDDKFRASTMFIRYEPNRAENIPFEITNAKMEVGSKLTDWSPAPEDTVSAIDEAEQNAKTYAKSQIDQTATGINLSVTELKKTTTDIQKSVDDMDVFTAWSWSEDGSDRFTREPVGENIIKGGFFNGKNNIPDVQVGYQGGATKNDYKISMGTHPSINNNVETLKVDSLIAQKDPGSCLLIWKLASQPKANDIVTFSFLGLASVGMDDIRVYILSSSTNDLNSSHVIAVKDNIKVHPGGDKNEQLVQISGKVPDNMTNVRVRIDVKGVREGVTGAQPLWLTNLTVRVNNESRLLMPPMIEDQENAIPKFVGTAINDSNSPADYKWLPNTATPTKKAWAWSADGIERFTTKYPIKNYWDKLKTDERKKVTITDFYYYEAALQEVPLLPNTTYTLIWDYENPTGNAENTHITIGKADKTWMVKSNLPLNEMVNGTTTQPSTKLKRFEFTTSSTIDVSTYKYLGFRLLDSGKKADASADFFNLAVYMNCPGINVYAPSPSVDPIGAIPSYIGLSNTGGNSPSNYAWSKNTDYIEEQTAQKIVETKEWAKAAIDLSTTNINLSVENVKESVVTVKNQVDNMDVYKAWAWNESGSDRFTREPVTENVISNGSFDRTRKFGVTTLNPDCYPDKWNSFNGGVPDPNNRYHAYVDNEKFGYNVVSFNESNGIKNWKGISQNLDRDKLRLSDSKLYLALNLYATIVGDSNILFGGIYYCSKSKETSDFYSGKFVIKPTIVNKWERFCIEAPFLRHDDVDWEKPMLLYIYGYGFSNNAILYVDDVSLRVGSSANVFSAHPQEKSDDAFPKYVGTSLENSDNPTDYNWTRNTEGSTKKAWAWSADGIQRFTQEYPKENLYTGNPDNKTIELNVQSWDNLLPPAIPASAGDIYCVSMFFDNVTDKVVGVRANLKWAKSDGSKYDVTGMMSSLLVKPGESKMSYVVGRMPEGAVEAVLAVKASYIAGQMNNVFRIKDISIKKVDSMDYVPTIYTPSPKNDPLGAIPPYIGFSNTGGVSPSLYTWSRNPDYVEKQADQNLSEREQAIKVYTKSEIDQTADKLKLSVSEVREMGNMLAGIEFLNNKDIDYKTGIENNGGYTITKDFITITPETNYTVSRPKQLQKFAVRQYDKDKKYLGSGGEASPVNTAKVVNFTTLPTAMFVKFVDQSNTDSQAFLMTETSASLTETNTKLAKIELDVDKVELGVSNAATKTELAITDGKITIGVGEAKDYADGVGKSAKDESKIYSDNVGKSAKEESKTYADGVGTATKKDAKDYADTVGNNTKQESKIYADGVGESAKKDAKDFATGEIAKVKVYNAWSWKEDGSEKFTREYPGENLYLDTKDFSRIDDHSLWPANTGWVAEQEKYKDLTVISKSSTWGGMYQTTHSTEIGESFTFSGYYKTSGKATVIFYSRYPGAGGPATTNSQVVILNNEISDWRYFSQSFTTISLGADFDDLRPRLEADTLDSGTKLFVAGLKLEKNINSNPIYTPSPIEDPDNAYPHYIGTSLKDSNDPKDYKWQLDPTYLDKMNELGLQSKVDTDNFYDAMEGKANTEDFLETQELANTLSESLKTFMTETFVNEISKLEDRDDGLLVNLNNKLANFQFLTTYIKLGEEGLVIGADDSPMKMLLTKDKLAFIDGGNTVAYFTNQAFYINRGAVVDSLTVNSHKIVRLNDDHTIVQFVGVTQAPEPTPPTN